MNWYAFVYGFGVIDLLILIYLFHRENPNTESKRIFVLLGVSALLWIGAEFLYYAFWGKITQIFYYSKMVGTIFIPYFVLMGVLSLPVRSKVLKFKFSRHIFFVSPLISLFFLFASPFNNLFIANFHQITAVDGHIRYDASFGPIFYLWYIPYAYSYILLSLGILIYNLRHLRTKIDEYLLITLFSAISIPLAMNVYHLAKPSFYPDPTSLSAVFSASLMVYSLLRFKWFSIPINEKWEIEDVELAGKSYLVGCETYKNIRNFMEKRNVLVVSTRDPKWIDAGIENNVIWISELDEASTIRPERLEFEIEYAIVEFLRQNPNGIVVLEGLAYLRSANSLSMLRFFLKDIFDVAASRGGTVLIVEEELSLFPKKELPFISEFLDNHVNISGECDKYGFIHLKNVQDIEKIGNEVFLLTPVSPKNIGFKGRYLRITGRGDQRLRMETEVLYRVEEEFKKGNDLCMVRIDDLFIEWEFFRIYRWMKLILDLARKYERKIYIAGQINDEKIRKIVEVYS